MRWNGNVLLRSRSLLVLCYSITAARMSAPQRELTTLLYRGGKSYITVSPTLAFAVPVNVAIGDKVAEAEANAAVGYLNGLPGAITSLSHVAAVQKGVDEGEKKAAETGQQVDREKLKSFVQEIVAKI